MEVLSETRTGIFWALTAPGTSVISLTHCTATSIERTEVKAPRRDLAQSHGVG